MSKQEQQKHQQKSEEVGESPPAKTPYPPPMVGVRRHFNPATSDIAYNVGFGNILSATRAKEFSAGSLYMVDCFACGTEAPGWRGKDGLIHPPIGWVYLTPDREDTPTVFLCNPSSIMHAARELAGRLKKKTNFLVFVMPEQAKTDEKWEFDLARTVQGEAEKQKTQ